MDIQEMVRQYSQNPQLLSRLMQSSDGQQLLRLLRQKGGSASSSANDVQKATQLLQSISADADGRRLLQRLAEQLKR